MCAVLPRSGCVRRLERVESLESLGADGTEICSSAAYWPPYTSPEVNMIHNPDV